MMLSCFNLSSNVRATCVSFLMITVQTALATRESILTVEAGNIEHYHSLEAPFIHDWFGEGVPLWDIGGDTVVTSQYVRLTPTQESRFGWAWNTIPMQVENWEARVTLRIHSQRHYGADGMALWLVEKPYKAEMAGPLMGMEAGFKGIGIIIDTYDNDGDAANPSIMVIKSDGTKSSWDTDKDLKGEREIHCTRANFRTMTRDNDVSQIKMSYYHGKLSVYVKEKYNDEMLECGKIEMMVPTGYYWGWTAHTGGVFDNHDIIDFQVRALNTNRYLAKLHAEAFAQQRQQNQPQMPNQNPQQQQIPPPVAPPAVPQNNQQFNNQQPQQQQQQINTQQSNNNPQQQQFNDQNQQFNNQPNNQQFNNNQNNQQFNNQNLNQNQM